MSYHVVLNRPTDLEKARRGAVSGENPRHSMAALVDELGARVHDGSGLDVTRWDRALGRLTRISALWWAVARSLKKQLRPGDVVYCTGEDVGIPVAILCGGRRGVAVAMTAHYTDRPKALIPLRVLALLRRVSLLLVVSRQQQSILQRALPKSDVRFIDDQTDTEFFRPGARSQEKERRLIVSVGLEKRDYTTLATATADLDIDVQISGFSRDTKVLDLAFPSTLPANMTRKFYSWPDLAQLYRDADVVVVSVFDNKYAAGVQAVMEGLATGRPVVATRTDGLAGYVDHPDAVLTFPPQDPLTLRSILERLLEDDTAREAMGQRARDIAVERYRLERYVQELASSLRGLDARPGR